jgi:CDP-paratose synthetase
MNILVTGATGFVGRHLIPDLIEAEHQLICVVRDIDKARALYNNKVSYVQANDMHSILYYKPECCIHLASFLTSKNDENTSKQIVEANLVFGCELLNILKDCHSLKLFINFGSFAEYRMGPSQVNPAYLYSATKTAFKQIVEYYADVTPFKHIHIIPYTIYGGIDTQKKVIDFLKSSLDATVPIEMTKGEQILDFIHVMDVVLFINHIITHSDLFIKSPNIDYHLGTGKGTSIRALASMIESKYRRKCNIKFGALPYRERDIMYAVAPIGRLIQMGWRPQRELEDYI